MSNIRKPLEWVGRSQDDFMEFPAWAKQKFGQQLNVAQWGERPPQSKPLQGFRSANVLQLSELGEEGTFRVVFTVRFDGVIYILHAFQKKSKSGGKTPEAELERIRNRLNMAKQLYEQRLKDDDAAETSPG